MSHEQVYMIEESGYERNDSDTCLIVTTEESDHRQEEQVVKRLKKHQCQTNFYDKNIPLLSSQIEQDFKNFVDECLQFLGSERIISYKNWSYYEEKITNCMQLHKIKSQSFQQKLEDSFNFFRLLNYLIKNINFEALQQLEQKGHYETALFILESCFLWLSIYQNSNYEKQINSLKSLVLNSKGIVARRLGEFSSAFQFFEQAIQQYQNKSESKEINELKKNQMLQIEQFTCQQINIKNSIMHSDYFEKEYLGLSYLNLSLLYSSLGNHKLSLENGNNAIIEQQKLFFELNQKKQNKNIQPSENFQISNQEFQSHVNTLATSYFNVASEMEYSQLWHEALRNYEYSYLCCKKYLGKNNKQTIQFYEEYKLFQSRKARQNIIQEQIQYVGTTSNKQIEQSNNESTSSFQLNQFKNRVLIKKNVKIFPERSSNKLNSHIISRSCQVSPNHSNNIQSPSSNINLKEGIKIVSVTPSNQNNSCNSQLRNSNFIISNKGIQLAQSVKQLQKEQIKEKKQENMTHSSPASQRKRMSSASAKKLFQNYSPIQGSQGNLVNQNRLESSNNQLNQSQEKSQVFSLKRSVKLLDNYKNTGKETNNFNQTIIPNASQDNQFNDEISSIEKDQFFPQNSAKRPLRHGSILKKSINNISQFLSSNELSANSAKFSSKPISSQTLSQLQKAYKFKFLLSTKEQTSQNENEIKEKNEQSIQEGNLQYYKIPSIKLVKTPSKQQQQQNSTIIDHNQTTKYSNIYSNFKFSLSNSSTSQNQISSSELNQNSQTKSRRTNQLNVLKMLQLQDSLLVSAQVVENEIFQSQNQKKLLRKDKIQIRQTNSQFIISDDDFNEDQRNNLESLKNEKQSSPSQNRVSIILTNKNSRKSSTVPSPLKSQEEKIEIVFSQSQIKIKNLESEYSQQEEQDGTFQLWAVKDCHLIISFIIEKTFKRVFLHSIDAKFLSQLQALSQSEITQFYTLLANKILKLAVINQIKDCISLRHSSRTQLKFLFFQGINLGLIQISEKFSCIQMAKEKDFPNEILSTLTSVLPRQCKSLNRDIKNSGVVEDSQLTRKQNDLVNLSLKNKQFLNEQEQRDRIEERNNQQLNQLRINSLSKINTNQNFNQQLVQQSVYQENVREIEQQNFKQINLPNANMIQNGIQQEQNIIDNSNKQDSSSKIENEIALNQFQLMYHYPNFRSLEKIDELEELKPVFSPSSQKMTTNNSHKMESKGDEENKQNSFVIKPILAQKSPISLVSKIKQLENSPSNVDQNNTNMNGGTKQFVDLNKTAGNSNKHSFESFKQTELFGDSRFHNNEGFFSSQTFGQPRKSSQNFPSQNGTVYNSIYDGNHPLTSSIGTPCNLIKRISNIPESQGEESMKQGFSNLVLGSLNSLNFQDNLDSQNGQLSNKANKSNIFGNSPINKLTSFGNFGGTNGSMIGGLNSPYSQIKKFQNQPQSLQYFSDCSPINCLGSPPSFYERDQNYTSDLKDIVPFLELNKQGVSPVSSVQSNIQSFQIYPMSQHCIEQGQQGLQIENLPQAQHFPTIVNRRFQRNFSGQIIDQHIFPISPHSRTPKSCREFQNNGQSSQQFYPITTFNDIFNQSIINHNKNQGQQLSSPLVHQNSDSIEMQQQLIENKQKDLQKYHQIQNQRESTKHLQLQSNNVFNFIHNNVNNLITPTLDSASPQAFFPTKMEDKLELNQAQSSQEIYSTTQLENGGQNTLPTQTPPSQQDRISKELFSSNSNIPLSNNPNNGNINTNKFNAVINLSSNNECFESKNNLSIVTSNRQIDNQFELNDKSDNDSIKNFSNPQIENPAYQVCKNDTLNNFRYSQFFFQQQFHVNNPLITVPDQTQTNQSILSINEKQEKPSNQILQQGTKNGKSYFGTQILDNSIEQKEDLKIKYIESKTDNDEENISYVLRSCNKSMSNSLSNNDFKDKNQDEIELNNNQKNDNKESIQSEAFEINNNNNNNCAEEGREKISCQIQQENFQKRQSESEQDDSAKNKKQRKNEYEISEQNSNLFKKGMQIRSSIDSSSQFPQTGNISRIKMVLSGGDNTENFQTSDLYASLNEDYNNQSLQMPPHLQSFKQNILAPVQQESQQKEQSNLILNQKKLIEIEKISVLESNNSQNSHSLSSPKGFIRESKKKQTLPLIIISRVHTEQIDEDDQNEEDRGEDNISENKEQQSSVYSDESEGQANTQNNTYKIELKESGLDSPNRSMNIPFSKSKEIYSINISQSVGIQESSQQDTKERDNFYKENEDSPSNKNNEQIIPSIIDKQESQEGNNYYTKKQSLKNVKEENKKSYFSSAKIDSILSGFVRNKAESLMICKDEQKSLTPKIKERRDSMMNGDIESFQNQLQILEEQAEQEQMQLKQQQQIQESPPTLMKKNTINNNHRNEEKISKDKMFKIEENQADGSERELRNIILSNNQEQQQELFAPKNEQREKNDNSEPQIKDFYIQPLQSLENDQQQQSPYFHLLTEQPIHHFSTFFEINQKKSDDFDSNSNSEAVSQNEEEEEKQQIQIDKQQESVKKDSSQQENNLPLEVHSQEKQEDNKGNETIFQQQSAQSIQKDLQFSKFSFQQINSENSLKKINLPIQDQIRNKVFSFNERYSSSDNLNAKNSMPKIVSQSNYSNSDYVLETNQEEKQTTSLVLAKQPPSTTNQTASLNFIDLSCSNTEVDRNYLNNRQLQNSNNPATPLSSIKSIDNTTSQSSEQFYNLHSPNTKNQFPNAPDSEKNTPSSRLTSPNKLNYKNGDIHSLKDLRFKDAIEVVDQRQVQNSKQ